MARYITITVVDTALIADQDRHFTSTAIVRLSDEEQALMNAEYEPDMTPADQVKDLIEFHIETWNDPTYQADKATEDGKDG